MNTSDFWNYPEHSRYKHEILRKYLPTFRRIARDWRNFIYIDGFAGSGKYKDDSAGSPILAIQELNKLYEESQLDSNIKVFCIFVEKRKENYRKLRENIGRLEYDKEAIIVTSYNETFENAFKIIKKRNDNLLNTSPSLFFLDPFGYNQIPFKILEEIFEFKKPEIILTFMVNFINRFSQDPSKSQAFKRLFGSDNWKNDFEENYSHIRDQNEAFSIFFQDLIKKTSAEYSIRYKIMHERTNQRIYDIIHATTHFKGLNVMKDIMFNVGIKGTFEYHGQHEDSLKYNKKLTDYIDIDPEISALKKWLTDFVIRSKDYTFDDLNEIIYVETPYIEKQLRKCLKEMEREGRVSITRVTSKTARGLSGSDRIKFNS